MGLLSIFIYILQNLCTLLIVLNENNLIELLKGFNLKHIYPFFSPYSHRVKENVKATSNIKRVTAIASAQLSNIISVVNNFKLKMKKY